MGAIQGILQHRHEFMSAKIITIFGSGNCREDSTEYQKAFDLGQALAEEGYCLANGGYGGTMEAAFKGSSLFNIRRIAVTAEEYGKNPNKWHTEEIKTKSYIDRLIKLIELGDAYIALAGSSGTLLEIAALWALLDRGLADKKPLLLFSGKWHELLALMRKYSQENDNIIACNSVMEIRDNLKLLKDK